MNSYDFLVAIIVFFDVAITIMMCDQYHLFKLDTVDIFISNKSNLKHLTGK